MKKAKADLLKIVFANIVSQGFLLILTGTFWDDWTFYYRDRIGLWKGAMEIGRPSSAYWVEAVWNLPHYGYRWLTFFMFLLTSIILYMLLNRSDSFSRKEALYLSILYTVFPINDCRVLLCVIVYTGGWLSFCIGLYMFSLYLKEETRRKYLLRVATLLFFGYSFTTNSLLAYYAIVLFYILYVEYSHNRSLTKAAIRMFKYIDFIILPIIFFTGKQLLFPAYGRYENYNSVTLSKVLSATFRLPVVAIKQIWVIWSTIFDYFVPHRVVIFCTLLIVLYATIRIVRYLIREKSMKNIWEGIIRSSDLKKVVLGIILFMLGMYPYMVAKNASILSLFGVNSRDTLLLGPGLTLIIFYCFKMVLKKEISRKIVFFIICFFCILTCNLHYMNYQRDAYWQAALISQLSLDDQIREAENILFLSDDDTGVGGTRFYSLNGNASVAYGDQSRLFMYKYSNLSMLQTDRNAYVESRGYLMNDYDASNDKLDGVAVYNCDINYKKCLQLKLLEMFRYSEYKETIENMGDLNYYSVDSSEARELLEGQIY